ASSSSSLSAHRRCRGFLAISFRDKTAWITGSQEGIGSFRDCGKGENSRKPVRSGKGEGLRRSDGSLGAAGPAQVTASSAGSRHDASEVCVPTPRPPRPPSLSLVSGVYVATSGAFVN